METKIIQPQELQTQLEREDRRKRVLLIDGNIPAEKDGTNYRFGSTECSGITPFGLKRIKSYLAARRVPCDLKHIGDVRPQDFTSYDIIGISALSSSAPSAFELTRKIKEINPQSLVIGGGEHFGLDAQWILEHKNITGVDACCTMQGELPLLSLAIGNPVENTGSLAYSNKEEVVVNPKYPRLTEQHGLEGILAPSAVVVSDSEPIPTPEMATFFKKGGSTQTSSGCNHACTFCTNGSFYGKVVSTLKTAEKEIDAMKQRGVDFMFVRDAMLNTSSEHLNEFKTYMQTVNSKDAKIAWYSFMSATPDIPNFDELAKSGALMIGVGLEDIVGDRKRLGKGNDLSVATKFIDAAKDHLLVRALLILGLPSHYQIPKTEIKNRMLEYMKAHPQAAYRINILTPTPGTPDFRNYADALADNPHKNPDYFRKFDNMHSVVDPKKMRQKLGIAELNLNNLYVQTLQDWEILRNDITTEYLHSQEHRAFVESLKGKTLLGRTNLLYDIANKFIEINTK